MHRIDGSTRSATLPAPQAAGIGPSSPGYFGHGDPVAGVSPTVPTVDWANAIQEELAAVIEHAGIPLDKTNNGQLLEAFLEILGGGGTTGTTAAGRWRKNADGTIDQWGEVDGSFGEGDQSFTFPIPFPTACESLIVTAINASSAQNHDIWAQRVAKSPSGGTVYLNYPQAGGVAAIDGFEWRAAGY